MKILKTISAAFIAATVLLSGCKKEEEETYEYLSGSLKVSFPEFVEPGFSKSFMVDTLMTLSRSDKGTIGYYYKDPLTNVYDTLVKADGTFVKHNFTITASLLPETLSFSFGAFTSGKYYGSSTSKSFIVIKPELDGSGSIVNFPIAQGEPVFTDLRDGNSYYYVTIDNTDWMRQNLNWKGAGVAYRGYDIASSVFGRFYTWEEAQKACPEGWRLPSDEDWVALAKKYGSTHAAGTDFRDMAGSLMENLYFNGKRMWEFWPEVPITNKSRLTVMPTGYALISDKDYSFEKVYNYAAFWTSDTSSDGKGIIRYIYVDENLVYRGAVSKTDFATTIRCVR